MRSATPMLETDPLKESEAMRTEGCFTGTSPLASGVVGITGKPPWGRPSHGRGTAGPEKEETRRGIRRRAWRTSCPQGRRRMPARWGDSSTLASRPALRYEGDYSSRRTRRLLPATLARPPPAHVYPSFPPNRSGMTGTAEYLPARYPCSSASPLRGL